MCCSCNKNKEKSLKERLFKKLKDLESQNSCACQEHEGYEYEDACCQDKSCDDVDEHLDSLQELLDNSKTAISQVHDMVEEIEETLEDVKEAIGQTGEDLEEAEEIIENLR